MSTYTEIVEQTLGEVSTYIKNQEPITVLTENITSSTETFSVDETKSISRGTIEIEDELLYVKSVNATESTVTIIPGTRGWRATGAAAHASGSLIRNNPAFPRNQVKRAINDTIKSINLPVLKVYEVDFDGVTFAYPLPSGVVEVTGISWNPPDTTGVWQLITEYRIDRNYKVDGDSNPRYAVVLNEAPMPGSTMRIQYTVYGAPLEEGDDFLDTGLPESCEDVVRFGAMWRLVSTVDPGKLIASTPSSDIVDQPVQAGTGSNISKYLYQLYTVRLEEERMKLIDSYQQSINYTRR
jgi:hypothetical protein